MGRNPNPPKGTHFGRGEHLCDDPKGGALKTQFSIPFEKSPVKHVPGPITPLAKSFFPEGTEYWGHMKSGIVA